MKKPASVHIDIAEFTMTVMELSTNEERGKWLLSLVKCLSYADSSLNSYGAKLLNEVNEYRESERARKEKYKEKEEPKGKTRKDTERHGKTEIPRKDTTEQTEQSRAEQNKEEGKDREPKKSKPSGLLPVYFQFMILGLTPDKAILKAEKFYSHYQSNGWKVSRNPMKDWKAATSGTWCDFTKVVGYQKDHLEYIVNELEKQYADRKEHDQFDFAKLKHSNPELFNDPEMFNDAWNKYLEGMNDR